MSIWLLSIPLNKVESETCLKEGFISLGEKAPNLPNLSSASAYELRQQLQKSLPEESPEAITLAYEPIWAFLHDWLPEDIILLTLHECQEVWIGHVNGPYHYVESAQGLEHRRSVRWEKTPLPLEKFTKEYGQFPSKSLFIKEFPDTHGLTKLKLDLDPKPNRKFLHRAQILFSLVCSLYILFMALKQSGFF